MAFSSLGFLSVNLGRLRPRHTRRIPHPPNGLRLKLPHSARNLSRRKMSSPKLIGPVLPSVFSKRSDEDTDDEKEFAGPALPPGYKRKKQSSSSDESEQELAVKKTKSHVGGDGPAQQVKKTNFKEDDDDDGFFGPALPPGFKKKSSPERPPMLGPALPPGFCRIVDRTDDDGEDRESFPGPALPPGYQVDLSSSDGEDEDVVGPMPAKEPVQHSVALDFERRAQKMKERLTQQPAPEVLTRETWMTELPPELQHVGLEARTFKKKSGPENKDRSIWTDTPADRERKARERHEGKKKNETQSDSIPQISHKDLEMADKVSKYNESQRGESLISLHKKKMKEKAKEKADKPVERRAFDRETDLQVNSFDIAQKKQLLKKCQELNTRFSHSKDRMFL
ncbi:GPALPP motifs-containing protein 1 isoform X2 [Thalassophryne amazonica]|uniref:GPALPP motifs-containing protein 1 isoform X2 n=1 Tax=Thalassophryne amazonica TaxID=390379 RepID=UPI00147223BC|nr:GPALPP motifs-containing protein 1 isoform X2 [Thalassophryne amazonica]